MNPADRIEKLRVGDIMIPLADYPKVSPEDTVRHAMEVMENSRLEVEGRKSLPRVLLVIDEANQLEGTVRRRDIMRGLEPKFLVTQPLNYHKKLFEVGVDPNLSELSYDRLVKGIRDQANMSVSRVMRPIEVALDAEDHILKAIYEMVSYGLTLLPVVSEDRVVGVIRTVELFRELSRIVLPPDESFADRAE